MRIFLFRLILWIVLMPAGGVALAQVPAGNDWVLQHMLQDFWKFPVHQTGVYRIDSTTLAQAGVLSVQGFDPRKIQVYHNGAEIAVYVHGEGDGVFDGGDYIEFFARKNDAGMDKEFFVDTNYRVNKEFSLYTDTACYFLTVGGTLQNKRLILEQAVDFANYLPAESYFLTKSWYEPAGTYSTGSFSGEDYGKDSRYLDGEGWVDFTFGIDYNMLNPKEINLYTSGVYQQGPPAELTFSLVGRSKYNFKAPAYPGKNHHIKLTLDGMTGELANFTYFGYSVHRSTIQVPSSNLSSGYYSKFILTAIDDMSLIPALDATRNDRNALARMELTYPSGTNLLNVTEKWMYIPDHPSKTKTYLSLANLNIPSGQAILYDRTNDRRITVANAGTGQQMLIPNSLPGNASMKECFLTSEGMIKQVGKLFPLTTGTRFDNYFDDFQLNQYDYLVITHTSLLPAANQYADYRRLDGYPHLYNPVVVDIESLYEQFSYGIRNNPLAIDNFLKYLYDNSLIPGQIFIIGKGYASIYTRRDSTLFRKSLIPGWGYPASDNIFLNKLGTSHIDHISIGRLAANDVYEVQNYLEKVRQYEDTLRMKSGMWMKRVIHLGGGSNLSEQTAIRNSLAKWEQTIEGPSFGGHVTTFLKTTSEPIEIITSQQLKNLINGGVRLMTFYGHGSANGFDISIDEVNSYENEGKYPLVIVNSCYSGDLFNKIFSKSEEFVLAEKKGAIAYIGSSNYSTVQVIDEMNDTLYSHMAQKSYGATLGALTRKALRPLAPKVASFYYLTAYQQSTLHGDPAIVLAVNDKPDYRITSPQVYFSPAVVTNELDSFTIHIISQNAGLAVSDTFAVKVTRIFPDKVSTDTILRFPSTAFQDTLDVRMPVKRTTGVGLNQFEVELDAMFEIQETDETNNRATAQLNIRSASLVPVYPYEFAVVPDPQVTLLASTMDPFLPLRKYHFQVDTSPYFTNPLATHMVQGKGGIFSWNPPLTLTDSTVYFWRVAPDSAEHPDGIFDWRYSSFQYIQGKRGWAQSHFHQFSGDTYQYISPDDTTGQFQFVQDKVAVTAQTGVYPNLSANLHFYSVNGIYQYLSSYMISQGLPGGFVFAIFDTITGNPVHAANITNTWDGLWGNLQEPLSVQNAFEFPAHTPQWQTRMTDFFDSIPQGYYVLAYSIKNHHAPDFPEALYQAFEGIGSSMIRTLPANTPYVIFGRKGAPIGDPQQVTEKMKFAISDTIRLDYVITTRWNAGHIITPDIGPAKEWSSVHWKNMLLPSDPYDSDSVRYSVIGVDASGIATPIPSLTSLSSSPGSILMLNQVIDAAQYPFIRLKVEMTDDFLHTPSQMKTWKVLYTPVGETALDPASSFQFHKDTIQQGDSAWFRIATRNISPYPMDSLLVRWTVTDGERNLHQSVYKRHRPHPAGDTLFIDSVGFNTAAMAPGLSTLWIEVNPVNPATGLIDQPEQTHINNIGEKSFLLNPDSQNPLLDVTFDGVHILDGDVVSARPAIEILLSDENPFFLFNQPGDTALFRIYLKEPGGAEYAPLYFMKEGIEQMVFYPASGKENRCRILFPADFVGKDGIYELKVEAIDKSQNYSGTIRYQISFRVISEATITEVVNWPNPFSTRTHFVFTLTGYELPADFRIQVMTISGKVVRELTLDDLGPVHIGRNITSGYWDGTDEFGDRLANGIYLYRVITSLGGETIRKAATGADQYFREGWGKMYLMR